MSTNVVNSVAFLRTSRNFPVDSQALSVEINKSYVDIANAVNVRTIGVFSTNRPSITGNSIYLTNQRQQTLRQIYPISGAGNYPHGINLSQIAGFLDIYGSFTDNTNWYPLPYVATIAANQVGVYVDPTNIVITAGAGAPTIVSGWIVLEWVSNP